MIKLPSSALQRSITGAGIVLLLLLALLLRGPLLLGLILVASALGLWEFYAMFWGQGGRIPHRIFAILLGWGMIVLTWLHRPQDALVCLGAGFVLAALTFLFRWDTVEEHEAFAHGGLFMAGLAYIPLLLLPATYLTSLQLALVIACTAASDTAAYFVGSMFGRHKLWPRVSPNKSSEGAIAGLAATVLICTMVGSIWGHAPWWAFLLLGILLNVAAQLGDLFESALKRSAGVKDSSNLLPGHGGVLDRADSLLFAMPTFAVVDQWYPFFEPVRIIITG